MTVHPLLQLATKLLSINDLSSRFSCSWGSLSWLTCKVGAGAITVGWNLKEFWFWKYPSSFFISLQQVVLFIIADMVASYWLALCFQASHVVSEVSAWHITHDWVFQEYTRPMVGAQWVVSMLDINSKDYVIQHLIHG